MSSQIDFDFKRISDPVHGIIGLSQTEARIINEVKAFIRLRSIKQLGLAHYVFPGADYSRLAHSIGVCHVAGRMIDSLRKNSKVDISDEEAQIYRLAGLLHDIGHYPFSHAMEDALQNEYSERNLLQEKGSPSESSHTDDGKTEAPLNHERVGKKILECDSGLKQILSDGRIDSARIHAIFTKEDPPRFANIISSDLDADRIDYLLRTSHHTGMPYGSVDIKHLLEQLCIDRDDRMCFTYNALHGADHLFLARYFDYLQIPFNKTVVGLELVLKDVIGYLVKKGLIDGSGPAITRMIEDGKWCDFNEGLILEKIRNLIDSYPDEVLKTKAESILYRIPPKMVGEVEYIDAFSGDETDKMRSFKDKFGRLKRAIPTLSKKFSIDEKFWYLWTKRLKLTDAGSIRTLPEELDNGNNGKQVGSSLVRIGVPNGSSQRIVTLRHSLMNVLSNYNLYAIRLYVLLPKGQGGETKRAITRELLVLPEFEDFAWKKPGRMELIAKNGDEHFD